MKENKNIERIFQERFKNFEATPPQDAWHSIENRLNKKEDKRIIPFWFKSTGIAALLVISLYFIANKTSESKKFIKNSVVETEDNNQNLNQDNTKTEIKNNQNIKSKPAITNNTEVIVSVKNKKLKNNNTLNLGKQYNLIKNSLSDVLAEADKKNRLYNNKKNNLKENKNFAKQKIDKFDEKENNFTNKNTLNSNENLLTDGIKIDSVLTKILLAETEIKEDTTLVITQVEEENILEKMLKEKNDEENAEEKEKINKWAVSSTAAPVYFNSFSNGSPINEQFSENTKSYETSLSYGVGVQYAVSKKISIKTGINSLAFNYNTNDVYYSAQFGETANANINSSLQINESINAENINLYSKKMPRNFSEVSNSIQENKGSLNQQLSYIEVPLEISYKVLNKKFGIDVIGGMSTLFLNNNSVTLVSNRFQMEIGEANNLNSIHFSSNVGLGFKYTFFKSFQANFQPMFKYQINTFSENSGNFKPYFIGLYSGLSFTF